MAWVETVGTGQTDRAVRREQLQMSRRDWRREEVRFSLAALLGWPETGSPPGASADLARGAHGRAALRLCSRARATKSGGQDLGTYRRGGPGRPWPAVQVADRGERERLAQALERPSWEDGRRFAWLGEGSC
jgi:hypothetical protein